jgi:excinuclease UvrABC nuclease subunit
MNTEKQLRSLVDEFLGKIAVKPDVKYQNFCCAELRKEYRKSRDCPKWADKAGVYYIFDQNSCIVYVGAGAAWYGVVHRVEERIRQKNLPEDTQAGAILFAESDWYWVWSLEAFLIDLLKPKFNDRIR